MRVLDLFSGIGGFSLGLERVKPFRTVAFCERDEFCQKVLKKHWPHIPIYEDVRTIPTDRLGRVDLICGGFPCQPWSVAGQRRGAEDDRDLWPIMASLVEKLRPRWVIGENVRGFINEPLGLKRSLSDLESIGYQATPFVIPACAVDAPHRRDRVWIIAHTNINSEPNVSINERARSGELVADADSSRWQRKWSKRYNEGSSGLCSGETQRRENFWLSEPPVGRVAHGIPRRMDRLKGLGNAVVPQVVEQIGKAILTGEVEHDL